MEEKKQWTVPEVLEKTVEILKDISIPISLAEQVGRPVLACIGNLNACIETFTRNAQQPQQPEEPEPDNVIDLGEIPAEDPDA